jgi:hypothetical protein
MNERLISQGFPSYLDPDQERRHPDKYDARPLAEQPSEEKAPTLTASAPPIEE